MSGDASSSARVMLQISRQVLDFLKTLLESTKPSGAETYDFQLERVLHFLATGEYSDGVMETIHALVTVAPNFIKFPVGEDLADVQQQFYRLSLSADAEFGFPNLIGAIDCVHVRFNPPDHTNMDVYINNKSEYSINVQLVCGPDLEIYNVLAAFPGRYEKLEIWKNSKLCQQLKQSAENSCWIVGDESYSEEPSLMTPIVHPTTDPDRLYNNTHSVVYECIEDCVRMMKTRFKCLNSVFNFNPDNVCAIVIACCVLHNICVSHNDFIELDSIQQSIVNENNNESPSNDCNK